MVKDTILTAEIYQMMYLKKTLNTNQNFNNKFETSPSYVQPTFDVVNSVRTAQVSDRKRQLLESLKTLTDKKIKTKQDKESIEIIKAVLENER